MSSPERELLRKILKDTAYIDYSFNDKIRNEIMNFLAQPEQESVVRFKAVDMFRAGVKAAKANGTVMTSVPYDRSR